jgi:hypothetical protein
LKYLIQKLVILSVLAVLSFGPITASAQTWGGNRGGNGTATNSADCGDGFVKTSSGLCLPADRETELSVVELIIRVINFLLAIAASIAILFIIIGGFRYIISAGNPDGAKAGKQTLFNAVIGLAIIILSYVIVSVVDNTINDCSDWLVPGILCESQDPPLPTTPGWPG